MGLCSFVIALLPFNTGPNGTVLNGGKQVHQGKIHSSKKNSTASRYNFFVLQCSNIAGQKNQKKKKLSNESNESN